MGMSSPNNSVFVYYGETLHPLLGNGSAYSISGQGGKFMMKAHMRTSLPQLELIEKIGRCANPRLVGYFGFQQSGGLFWDKQDVQILWELFSYNLSQEINYLRILQKPMEEDLIWQIIACLVQACKFLRTYHIYPDLELAKVEFSAAKEPKLFWADILPQNMHRAYERCVNSHQFRQALYSPEQLVEINRQNHKIVDKEKCVVFSIGMIMLECICKKGVQTIYEYDNKAFSEAKKREILNEIPPQYSPELSEVLQACLQYFPKDRYDYQNLQTKINEHFLKQKRLPSNQMLEKTESELK